MTPEATRRKTYGWKLATFRLPTDTYMFDVLSTKSGPDDTVELELKIVAGDYIGHRVRAFLPKDERFYERRFRGRLEADYGIIVPATVEKFAI
jgi:hypothetical protein